MQNLKLLFFFSFRDMTSHSYNSQAGNESSQFDTYPRESTNLRKKSLFVPENIFSSPKLYSPMQFPSFQSKQKIICSVF